MNPAVVILSVLFFTSAILCATMTLAWFHFGRQKHAASWATAYGLGALQWVVNAFGVLAMPGAVLPSIMASATVLGSGALVAIGARQRAGLPPRTGWFMALGGLTLLAITLVYTVFPYPGLQGALSNLYAGGAIAVGAISTWPRGRKPNAPEWAFIVMMTVFTLYLFVLGMAALQIGAGNREALQHYRAVLGLGLPAVYIGGGISAVFLLAGDLSENMRQLITRDGLTGALNRRGLEQAAMGAIASAHRRATPLTVVIGDIDHFKAVNDRYGHVLGDAALVAFADNLQAAVREVDIVGRLGGDEFCLLLTDLGADASSAVVERIRAEIERIVLDGWPDLMLTASFGVASFDANDVSLGPVLRRADHALYRAKEAGRNRVVVV